METQDFARMQVCKDAEVINLDVLIVAQQPETGCLQQKELKANFRVVGQICLRTI